MLRPYYTFTARFYAAARRSDSPAPASANSRTRTTRADPPPFSPLHPHFAHSLHEALAHLLIARPLHRREIARHFLIFVLLDLDHVGATRPHPVHQSAHAVGVGGDARLHLIVERAAPLQLLLHERAAARVEALLRAAQL